MTDPIAQYETWFADAAQAGGIDPKAACLSTVGPDSRPSSRLVLVQYADARGFVFFTNFGSRKALDLRVNAGAALCWYWPALERQVRAEGLVSPVAADEADRYFATRPRESQIGAWASRQSEPLASRETLETRVRDRDHEFAGRDVPRPPFWGGFVLSPDRVEFWTGGPGRLHHRQCFEREGPAGSWRERLLYP